MAQATHVKAKTAPKWQRWLGFSEVWAGSALSSRTLLSLRWLAVVGQGATIYMARSLGVEVPLWPCLAALAMTAITNTFLEWWLRQIYWDMGEGFFHVLLLDLLILTFILYWTGGLANPFALFYLVHLTLAAVALRAFAVISLGVLMAGAAFWLWQYAVPLTMSDGTAVPAERLMQGFITALVLAGVFLVTLLLALRRRSHRFQKERARLRHELDARDRFLSVAALATGFAHELGTPLGTIALAAEEMKTHPDAETAATILRETERCRRVLHRLRELGQEATEGSSVPSLVRHTVEAALDELPPAQRARVRLEFMAKDETLTCAGLREALLVLLRNALQASPAHEQVVLGVEAWPEKICFMVEDRGPGFSDEMLRHAGEPFRSTRDPSSGMGLGLFFVRRLAASMRGSVLIENLPQGGARVTVSLPQHPFASS